MTLRDFSAERVLIKSRSVVAVNRPLPRRSERERQIVDPWMTCANGSSVPNERSMSCDDDCWDIRSSNWPSCSSFYLGFWLLCSLQSSVGGSGPGDSMMCRYSTGFRDSAEGEVMKPAFQVGDRVLMFCHADWKVDCTGTVTSPGRIRKGIRGEYIDYSVQFDEPQADLTDEMHGDLARRYSGSTVAEEYLQPLDSLEE